MGLEGAGVEWLAGGKSDPATGFSAEKRVPSFTPTKNTLLSTKSVFFVYPSRRLGISSAVRRYIIKGGLPPLYIITAQPCISFLRLDEIQPFRADEIQSLRDWWYARLRLDLSTGIWYTNPNKSQFIERYLLVVLTLNMRLWVALSHKTAHPFGCAFLLVLL